jgi:hypothetical protein
MTELFSYEIQIIEESLLKWITTKYKKITNMNI